MADASPLAGLVAEIARRSGDLDALGRRPIEPDVLDHFRRVWSRLSAEQRLAASLSALPENAGPLNSHHLVHRALATIRELSPDYFDRFSNYVDALLWLESADRRLSAVPAKKAGKRN